MGTSSNVCQCSTIWLRSFSADSKRTENGPASLTRWVKLVLWWAALHNLWATLQIVQHSKVPGLYFRTMMELIVLERPAMWHLMSPLLVLMLSLGRPPNVCAHLPLPLCLPLPPPRLREPIGAVRGRKTSWGRTIKTPSKFDEYVTYFKQDGEEVLWFVSQVDDSTRLCEPLEAMKTPHPGWTRVSC